MQVNGVEKGPIHSGNGRSVLDNGEGEPGRWTDRHVPHDVPAAYSRDDPPEYHYTTSSQRGDTHTANRQNLIGTDMMEQSQSTSSGSHYWRRVERNTGSDADAPNIDSEEDEDASVGDVHRDSLEGTLATRHAVHAAASDSESRGDGDDERWSNVVERRSSYTNSSADLESESACDKRSRYDWGEEESGDATCVNEEIGMDSSDGLRDSDEMRRNSHRTRVEHSRGRSPQSTTQIERDLQLENQELDCSNRESYTDGYFGTKESKEWQSLGAEDELAMDDEGEESVDRLKHVNASLLLSLRSESEVRLQLEEKMKRMEVKIMIPCELMPGAA